MQIANVKKQNLIFVDFKTHFAWSHHKCTGLLFQGSAKLKGGDGVVGGGYKKFLFIELASIHHDIFWLNIVK